MEPVVSVSVMRQSDAWTIARETDSRELMRRAGEGLFQSVPWRAPVGIVCGTGNNAGDGYVLALALRRAGIDATLLLAAEKWSEDGRFYFDQCVEAGVPWHVLTPEEDLSAFQTLADCLLGTGFRGEARPREAAVIEKINRSGAFVVAADINSGLNGDSGLGEPAVRSDLTVSIGAYQPGHFLGRAKDCIGRLSRAEIGIRLQGRVWGFAQAEDLAGLLLPRPHFCQKGDFGYVGILGGCREYSGAVKLANLSQSALRAGCGVAALMVPQSLGGAVMPYLLESTLTLFAETDGHMRFDPQALDAALERKAALAVGMGWGKSADNARILAYILENYAFPLVIDADGLNTLAGMDKEILRRTRCRVVLTPHLLEFSRLSGRSREEIAAAPVERAEEFAARYGVCLLLKGPATIVTDGETTLLTDRGCPGMATAGSGDVLSGILCGLLGYAPATPRTAALGAYIAGRAGELAQAAQNPVSMTASDTVAHIGAAVTELWRVREENTKK